MTDRLVALLLRVAQRRWPTELDMAREWQAELQALRDDSALGWLSRTVRKVRFAASLAMARPPTPPEGVDRVPWRETALVSSLGQATLVVLGRWPRPDGGWRARRPPS
jgi:hypothetical protein